MPFVPFPNTVKVEMIFSQAGQIVQNVFHVRSTEFTTPGALINIAEVFKEWWDVELQTLVSSKVTLTSIKVTSLQTATALGIEYVDGLPLAALGSPNALPNNATVAVKWITGVRGRSFRGRTYHIGLSTLQVSESSLNEVSQNALQTAYRELITLANDADMPLVVASKIENGQFREVGEITFITDCSINRTLDSQRRRLPERGT